MKLGTILVATDFSPGAECALARAAHLAEHFQSPLVVAHALDPISSLLRIDKGERAALDASLREGAGEELERRVAELRRGGLEARAILREGHAVAAIVKAAGEVDADLVVTGARGLGGDNVFVIGSVAEGVARRAYGNVLVARGEADSDLFHRVVIATDLTHASQAVIPTAMLFAAPDAEVELMHAVDWGDHAPPIRGPHGSPARDFKKLWNAAIVEAERALAELAERSSHPTLNLRYRVVEGVAAAEILRREDDGRVDLFVVGKHAEGPPAYASVAERVVRHASCSVLVTRRTPGQLHALP